MPTISHQELRKNIGAVLRRAEAGEEFTITASGQPVARLGPVRKRTWVDSSVLEELAKLPVDESLASDLEDFDIELRDPWTEQGTLFTRNYKDFKIADDLVNVREPPA